MKHPTVYGKFKISLENYIEDFTERFEKIDNVKLFYNIYIGLVDSTYKNATDKELKNIEKAIDKCYECGLVLLKKKSVNIIFEKKISLLFTKPIFAYYCNICSKYLEKCVYCNEYYNIINFKYEVKCGCKYKTFYKKELHKEVVRKNPSLFFEEFLNKLKNGKLQVCNERGNSIYDNTSDNDNDNGISNNTLLEQFISLENVNYSKDKDGNNDLFLLCAECNDYTYDFVSYIIDNVHYEHLLAKNYDNQDIYMYLCDKNCFYDINKLCSRLAEKLRNRLGLCENTDIDGKTTLMYDIQYRLYSLLDMLSSYLGQLNNTDNDGDSALIYAINLDYSICKEAYMEYFEKNKGEDELIKNLLKNPDDKEVIDDYMNHVNRWARTEGRFNTYILIKLGINMQTINVNGITPLMNSYKSKRNKKYNIVNIIKFFNWFLFKINIKPKIIIY
jgi:hypothetical protein